MSGTATAIHEPHVGSYAGRRRRRSRLPFTLAVIALLLLIAGGGTVVAVKFDLLRLSAAEDRAATDPLPEDAAPNNAGAANPTTQDAAQPGPGDSDPATATGPVCTYESTPGGVPGAPPPPASRSRFTGPVHAVITTDRGSITLELDAATAPCTVNSFVSLVTGRFYAGSPCHRLTTAAIFVLQCGDPTGSGSGGPGYRFPDENLPTQAVPAYPRGTLAMANAGPGTNGSQFFLVYRDSAIEPNYPVFGRVVDGLQILDEVATGGAANNDGPPNLAVTITSVEIKT